jgi:Ca2+/Na+ antiporter
MNGDRGDTTMHILRQTRTLLILTVLMCFSSNIIDPPFSTFGGVLNLLTLVVLVFVVLRIQRSISESKSSSSNP